MEKKKVEDFFKDQKMFCPSCQKKVDPVHNEVIKKLIREKAREIAQEKDLQKVIEEKDYEFLDFLAKFKKLEDGCKFCPTCGWSPFYNLLADKTLRKFTKDFPNEIKGSRGGYLLDMLPSQGKRNLTRAPLKKTIRNMFKN